MKRYRGLTRAQQDAFEAIATGVESPWMHPKTREALLAKGLIVEAGKKLLMRDRFGAVHIPVYEVPTHEHIAWCQWCSEHFPAGG